MFKESEVEANKTRITPDDVSQSREYFLDGDFTIITTVDALPRPVLQALTEDGIVRLLMANPGEKFDATDAISDSEVRPRMRLIFGGAGNGKFLIHYEQGGRSHMFVLALFNLVSPNNAKLVWRAYCNNGASTLAQLRSRVLTGECRYSTVS